MDDKDYIELALHAIAWHVRNHTFRVKINGKAVIYDTNAGYPMHRYDDIMPWQLVSKQEHDALLKHGRSLVDDIYENIKLEMSLSQLNRVLDLLDRRGESVPADTKARHMRKRANKTTVATADKEKRYA